MGEIFPKREACRGSCHCGLTQYIVFLTLPHLPQQRGQEIYRCNCSTCHKMNFFHVNPANPREDFVLLAPLDPDHGLSTYQCYDKKRKYYFCPTCGVRCFTFTGVGERDLVDFTELADNREGKREVWRAKWDGDNDRRPYISVNGITIDFREDFDLIILTEEKRVQYLDGRSEPEVKQKEARWDRPHYGGCY